MSKVSNDWTIAALSKYVASLDAGVSVNSEDRPHEAGEIGVLKTSALSNGVFEPNRNKAVISAERHLVAESVLGDSILVSRMNTPELVGESCYVSSDWPDLFLPDRIWQLKLIDREHVDMRWLSYVLQSWQSRRYIQKHATGTSGSMKNLPKKALLSMTVAFPKIPEQRRIARILETLDEDIKLAEQVIAKSLVMRRGLVNDLLGGQPRSSKLRDGLVGHPANGLYKPADAIGSGSLLIGQTAFTRDRHIDSGAARRAVTTRSELDRFGLEDEDILVSRVFATLEGVGQPAFVLDLPEPAVYESNMMRLRPDKNRADGFFLFQTLQTRPARAWIMQRANLSNQASVSQDVLASMPVWLPDPNEQRRISSILSADDEKRHAEEDRLRKLRLIRQGFMSDLLTGRVRVPAEARV